MTLGDLRVRTGELYRGYPVHRSATLADLVSALRAEDPLEIMKCLMEQGAERHDCAEYTGANLVLRASDGARLKCEWVLDALAEAQPE